MQKVLDLRCLTRFWTRLCCVRNNCLFVKFLIHHYLLLFLDFSSGLKFDSNYWNDLVLRSVETYFLEYCAYVFWKGATMGVWEGHFCWIWVKISLFWNIKTGEWDLKMLLFNYWNDLVLGLVETCFLEVDAYVSLKLATTGVWEVRFGWIWLKISLFLNIKTGEWNLKLSLLLKWSCLRLSRNIFSKSRCICVSKMSHRRCLRGSFLLNLSENVIVFEI